MTTSGMEIGPDEPTDLEPKVDDPFDMRPDLDALGIFEIEKGVCQDTFPNRAILREAKLTWDYVYDALGNPMDLLSARSPAIIAERRVMMISKRRSLLAEPTKNNSEYLTGLELLLDDEAVKMAPPWVLGSTAKYNKQRQQIENGTLTLPEGTEGFPLPHRCIQIKNDGLRCLLWSSGRPRDKGFCGSHLAGARIPKSSLELARKRLVQTAPFAVDALEELMLNAQSEPVKLKAATELLDRAGVRGGVEIAVAVDVQNRTPAEIVSERLRRLSAAAIETASHIPADTNITDAEVVISFDSSIQEDGPPTEDGDQ